jgi:glycosyltransferase involved in cell wall biosynthesis
VSDEAKAPAAPGAAAAVAQTGATSAHAMPFISVVIPMRNEAAWLDPCLGSVLAQDWPADRMEVLIVDGMSDDGSYESLLARSKADARLRVFRNPARIVPSSLNIAIEAARGDVIARVDAHTTLEPGYLRAGAEILARTGADNVGGPMVSIGGGPVGDAIATAMRSRFGIGAYFHFASDERDADTVYMGMWPRDVFRRVGLFDEELVRNQDDEFSYRIRKAGGRIVCSPRMRSRYQNRQSWRALAKQFYQYGFWKVRVLQKHPAQMSVRHFVPPAFDAAVLAGLAAGSKPRLFAVAALLVYAVAMVAVAAVEAAPGVRLRTAAALAIIHHAWGVGFLIGLVRFAGRWLKAEPPARRLAAGAEGREEKGSCTTTWCSVY